MHRTPIPVVRALRQLGTSVATTRKLQGITSAQLADRAGVSRSTLSALENGASTSSEALLRVLRSLGIMDTMVDSLDPYSTDVGKLRMDEALPKRVRG